MAIQRKIQAIRGCYRYLLCLTIFALVCVMLLQYDSHFHVHVVASSKLLQETQTETPSRTFKHGAKSPLLIIIAAYMHTGSTYTGSVFQQHPGSFYDYEALRSAVGSSRRHLPVLFLNGSYRQFHGDWVEEDGVARELVQNLLDCKYQSMDLGTMDSYFYNPTRPVYKHRKPFLDCLQEHKKVVGTTRIQRILDCLPYLVTPCIKAHIRVFKFIRFPLSAVGELLRDNENLKIIHLVRDPRAMMDSQVRKNDNESKRLSNFTVNTKRICNRMMADLSFFKTSANDIQRNIKLVRYEDLTDFPQDVMRKLFEFVNLNFTKKDVDYVQSHTRNDSDLTKKLPTWRKHMKQPFLDVVNKHCKPLYKELGYIEHADIADIQDIEQHTYITTK